MYIIAITVVDSIMGSGKTEAMINYINDHPEQSIMVITPFLAEIERIKYRTDFAFYDPQNYGDGKLDNLNSLLSAGKNIACTHSLFLMTNDETWDYIAQGQYILFIDEALDIVKPINDLIDDPRDKLKKGSANFLIDRNLIAVDAMGYVTWIGEKNYGNYEYTVLEQMIRGGNVLCAGGQLFLWMFPPKVFTTFSYVYVLTYLFKGSLFGAYMTMHHFKYELKSACKAGNIYSFTGYIDDSGLRKSLKAKINICNNQNLNAIGAKASALSKSWYENKTGDEHLAQLKRHLNAYRKRSCGLQNVKSSEIMWTTFKSYRNDIAPSGYKFIRRLSKEEAQLEKEHPDAPEIAALRCFVACNARATNSLSERRVLAYLVNRYYNPMLKRLFNSYSIELDDDKLALAEMLQWIWRSAIRRQPPENIWLYIPSRRMRQLLEKWLSGEQL